MILTSGNFWRENMGKKIKIISGWSNEGGSTFSLMELCELFNERGYDCTFYGPHNWHLDKCKGDHIHNLKVEEGDTLIGHFLELPEPYFPARMTVLSCHEKEIFKLKEKNIKGYEKIRFVSEDQMSWQGVYGKVIPNCIRGVKLSKEPEGKVAGVIGTITEGKQAHVSIERAIKDGCDKVLIYGNMYDEAYYNSKVKPLLNDGSGDNIPVIYMGMEMDKQKIYDSISCVYQSNSDKLPEAYGRVRAECIRAGIEFHGNKNCMIKNLEIWDEDKIFDAWMELLKL